MVSLLGRHTGIPPQIEEANCGGITTLDHFIFIMPTDTARIKQLRERF